jgi:hypothetical protein
MFASGFQGTNAGRASFSIVPSPSFPYLNKETRTSFESTVRIPILKVLIPC